MLDDFRCSTHGLRGLFGLFGVFGGDSAKVTLRRAGLGGGGGGAALGGGGGVGNDIDGDGSDVSSLAIYHGLIPVCGYCCAPGRPRHSQSRWSGRNTVIFFLHCHH